MEATTYQFTINSNSFPMALDIYSQFFKAPLFDTDSLSREIVAIDSEDSKNRILDGRRNLQILKHLIASNCGYENFSTGNVKTLGNSSTVNNISFEYIGSNLKSKMLKFYTKYYVPSNMVLTLVGPQSLSELESYANSYFADIGENLQSSIASECVTSRIPFSSASVAHSMSAEDGEALNYPFLSKGLIVKSRPIADVNELSILYSFPFTTRHLYRQSPTVLLAYLLSNKYKNSLYDILFNELKYILSLSAGVRESFVDFCLFEVNVKLTEKGLKHAEEVIGVVNRYLQFIENCVSNNTSSIEYLNKMWYELHVSSEIDFKYQERSAGYDVAQNVVHNMLHYPSQHVFSGGWLIDDRLITEKRDPVRDDIDFSRSGASADTAHSLDNYLLLQKMLGKHMTPMQSVVFMRSSQYKEWIPADASDLDLSDAHVRKLISEQRVHELLRINEVPGEFVATPTVNRIEPYYGIPYQLDSMSDALISRWNTDRFGGSNNPDQFQLPPVNEFIC